jgi:predicted nucleotidyltransferase
MKTNLKAEIGKLGVAIVYLFGSKATRRASRLSDIDIGIVLKTPAPGRDTRALYHMLYQLFSEVYPRSKLDIVFLQTAPLTLQYSAIKDGKILFEEDPKLTADYVNLVINQYLDFKPVLDLFDQVSMERYAKTESSSK